MRTLDICNLVRSKIPQFTPEFSDVKAANISIASGVVTVTATAHGLLAGDTFTLSGFSVFVDGIENEVINYSHTVATVTDVDTFTFTIVQEFVTASGSGTLHTGIRVYTTATPDLALKAYAKIGSEYKKALYIVDLGETTSKDRGVGNDADFQMIRNTDFKMTFINNFGILAVLPIKNDTAGGTNSDFARELLSYMVGGVVGERLPTDWENSQSTGISFTSSNRQISNNAYIVQNYMFEVIELLSVADINRDTFGYNINDIRLVVEPQPGV